jgi:hypothetical protein
MIGGVAPLYRDFYKDFADNCSILSSEALAEDDLFAFQMSQQKYNGLKYTSKDGFNFVYRLAHIYISCLTRDVLIIFNQKSPQQMVKDITMRDNGVQDLYRLCLPSGSDSFGDLSVASSPAGVLFRDIVTGFHNTYNKDRYKKRSY